MRTIWQVVKDTVNSHEIGEKVSRQELIKAVENEGYENSSYRIENIFKVFTEKPIYFSEVTVDLLRNKLEKSGYLDKAESAVVSYVHRKIASDLTVSKLTKEYYESFKK